MARRKAIKPEPAKMTPAMMKLRIGELEEDLDELKSGAYCYLCDKHMPKDKFYTSTDPQAKSGVTRICRLCAKKIALRTDKNGQEHEPTKDSVIKALMYLDKPFLETIWNASIGESTAENIGRIKNNVWTSYIKNIAMPQYNGMCFQDSDFLKEKVIYDDEIEPETEESIIISHQGQDTYDAFLKNKSDVVRLLDFDPFEKESVSDQPFLYSQLLGMLDQSGEANEDMLRTSAAISIVRGFLQANKIDDTLVGLMSDVMRLEQNSATIKSLQESKSKIMSNIKDLAAENCLSLKNNKSAVKGENTFTGKLRKLKELDIGEKDNNGFDIETCKGMQQVANISMAAIIDKLNLDESEWSEIVAEQRQKLADSMQKANAFQEANRLLLRENIDLRKVLASNSLLDSGNLIDLDELLEIYKDKEQINAGDSE